MLRSRSIWWIPALLLFAVRAPAQELRAALQARLDAFVASGAVPGVAAGIARADGSALALAAGVSDRESGRALGHQGYMPGYLTEVRHWPESGVTVAVQVNTSDARALPERLGRLAEDLLEIEQDATR